MSTEKLYDGVVFTTDVLKVDDRSDKKYENPQEIHSDWLFSLFGTTFSEILNCKISTLTGTEPSDPLNRFKFYSDFQLPFDSSGWASAFHSDEDEADYIAEALKPYKNHLFFGFELSPLLINALNKASIHYIDLTLHAIRFLPDYVFGMRTNVPEFQERIAAMTIPHEDIVSHARMSLGRSARVFRNVAVSPGSAVFLGQIDVDSSLIDGKKMITPKEVISTLIELKSYFPKVYYKFHPHFKNRQPFEAELKSHNINILDVNIYDLFVIDKNITFCSISSGSLIEAELFGKTTLRLSKTPSPQGVKPSDVPPSERSTTYLPVSGISLTPAFWRYLFSGSEEQLNPGVPLPSDAMKFMINQKWGR